MSDLAIVILAAGKGTRMKTSLPKVLHPIAGKPMLHHVLDCAAELKPTKTVVVLSPDADEIITSVKKYAPKANIVIQDKPLGTAHAVMAAESALKNHKGPVLVCYGDTPFILPETLKLLIAALQRLTIAVLGFESKDPGGYGRLVTNNMGDVEAIIEAREASATVKKIKLCNSGVMGFDGSKLFGLLKQIEPNNSKKEFYLTDIIGIARRASLKTSVVIAPEAEVLGVNSQAQLADAEALFQQKLRHKALEHGVQMMDPATVYLRADTEFGRDVVLHPHVVFGDGVKLGDGVEIRSFSHIEQAILGKNTRVGPVARIRPGTVTGEDVHIGNFVEIKNAKLEKHAKVNHLSYVGDATVGASANIGAGAITCNYDGVNKHHTDIGEGVFVGSNTSLVAPVSIGKGAMIGAGSTITKDVEAGALAINIMPQKQEKGRAKSLRAKQQKK